MKHDVKVDFSNVINKGPKLTMGTKKSRHVNKAKTFRKFIRNVVQCSKKRLEDTKVEISKLKTKVNGACLLLLDKRDGFRKVEVLDNGKIEKTGKCLIEKFNDSKSIDIITAFEQIKFNDLLQISKSKKCCSTKLLAEPLVENESDKYRYVYIYLSGIWYVVLRKDGHKYLLSLSSFFTENKGGTRWTK